MRGSSEKRARSPHAQATKHSFYARVGKRLFDRVAAVLALVALGPVMVLTALAVRATLGSPILFRQVRPGLGGSPFALFKFRSMTISSDGECDSANDGGRLTSLGRFLRETSLDELPGLFNVLRGEMSLVGPRPLLMEYRHRYSPEQARRHDVLPGITGWAQINGRNAQTWEDRFALDIWYVDHLSFVLDLRIMLATAVKVIRRDGVAASGHATMPKFGGTKS